MSNQIPYKLMTVIEIETGEEICIKDFGFDEKLHKKITKKGKKKTKKVEPVEETDRFAELKLKGWVNLSKEERAEYKLLKD